MTFPGSSVALALSTGWPAKPFSQWSQSDAMQVVSAGLDMRALAVNRDFFLGDHWQNGDGWVGPWPDWQDETANATMLAIFRMFTSRNVIKEVVERHVAGVVGTEPTWGVTPRRAIPDDEEPTDDEQKLIDEAEAKMTVWWDRLRVREKLQEAARKLLYSGGTARSNAMTNDDPETGGSRQISAPGRAVLRLYVPRALLGTEDVFDGNGVKTGQRRVLKVKQGDIDDALSKIHVDVPEVEFAHVYEDPSTLTEIGVCNVQARVDQAQSAQPLIEMTYLDDGGMTVLASVGTAQSAEQSTADNPGGQVKITFDLGKRLLMSEMQREAFLSQQVREAQKLLNFCNSMIPRNVETSGFLEQVILSGMQPGHWEGEGTDKKWVPAPYYRGAGVVNWVSPIEYDDAQGNKHLTTPQIHDRAPVPPTASIEAKREAYRDILEECDQAHILITGEATPSGKSREQSRADFEQSLHLTQTPVERTGRWLIETVLAFAEVLAGVPGKYTSQLRATFDCVIDLGPISAAEQTNDLAAYEAGVLSRETTQSRRGIADTDAETRRIMEQDGGALETMKQKAMVYGLWIAAGLSEEVAAQLSGMSTAEIALIKKMVKDNPPADPSAAPGAPGAPGAGGGAVPPTNGRGAPNRPARAGVPLPNAMPTRSGQPR